MINEFKGDHRWLSNFEAVKITLDGIEYPSIEHAYMSAKCDDPEWKKFCADENNTAGSVKKQSRHATVKLVENWDSFKMDVMFSCLEQKYSQEPFKSKLIDTGSQNLVEGNYFGDKIWGVDLKSNPNIGENHLGRMIMSIRQNLIDEMNSGFTTSFRDNLDMSSPKQMDIIQEAELDFKILESIFNIFTDGQKFILKNLHYDKEKISKSFNIYDEIRENETLEQLIDSKNHNIDESIKEIILTNEEIETVQELFLEISMTDKKFTPLQGKTIKVLSKYINLFALAYSLSLERQEMYLELSERDEN